MEVDWDNFIFIGNKIEAGIYEIPKVDLKWFNKTKKDIDSILERDAELRKVLTLEEIEQNRFYMTDYPRLEKENKDNNCKYFELPVPPPKMFAKAWWTYFWSK